MLSEVITSVLAILVYSFFTNKLFAESETRYFSKYAIFTLSNVTSKYTPQASWTYTFNELPQTFSIHSEIKPSGRGQISSILEINQIMHRLKTIKVNSTNLADEFDEKLNDYLLLGFALF